jgi:hypothetical protein
MTLFALMDRSRAPLSSCLVVVQLAAGPLLAQPTTYQPPARSAAAVVGIQFDKALQVNEGYRSEFINCDRTNRFRGQVMPSFRQCSGDANNVRALLRFPDGTVFFDSKLSLDIDGSWLACKGSGAPTSQCPTSYNWPIRVNPGEEHKRFVDSDNVPYIVIPTTDLAGRNEREFRHLTGVEVGDLGIVVYKNVLVPVFVADGGPHNKLGEGSSRLHELIGADKCRPGKRRADGTRLPADNRWTSDHYCLEYRNVSESRDVLTFIFPGSRREIAGLGPAPALARIQQVARQRFEQLKQPPPGPSRSPVQLQEPSEVNHFSIGQPVRFSGTADPAVKQIVASIGPGGPFRIANVTNVGTNWSFLATFRNPGQARVVTIQPFDTNGTPLPPLTFILTIE